MTNEAPLMTELVVVEFQALDETVLTALLEVGMDVKMKQVTMKLWCRAACQK